MIASQNLSYSLESLESTLNSSRIIFLRLVEKLLEATKLSTEIIRTIASLLFYTITTLKNYALDEQLRGFVQEQSRDLVQSVHNEIIRWIQKVYGNTFGSAKLEASFGLKMGNLIIYLQYIYLQFCQSLYKLDCPQHIQESWQPAMLQTIKKQIKRVVCVDYCCCRGHSNKDIVPLFVFTAYEQKD